MPVVEYPKLWQRVEDRCGVQGRIVAIVPPRHDARPGFTFTLKINRQCHRDPAVGEWWDAKFWFPVEISV